MLRGNRSSVYDPSLTQSSKHGSLFALTGMQSQTLQTGDAASKVVICQNNYAIDEYNRGGVVEQIEHEINAIQEDSAWSKKLGADPL